MNHLEFALAEKSAGRELTGLERLFVEELKKVTEQRLTHEVAGRMQHTYLEPMFHTDAAIAQNQVAAFAVGRSSMHAATVASEISSAINMAAPMLDALVVAIELIRVSRTTTQPDDVANARYTEILRVFRCAARASLTTLYVSLYSDALDAYNKTKTEASKLRRDAAMQTLQAHRLDEIPTTIAGYEMFYDLNACRVVSASSSVKGLTRQLLNVTDYTE